jgi:glycosyltransferase involved in cell wall biosynthesis
VLLSFNQEKYIADALAGAFAQTYSPLEIIVSDDRSADDTFAIIKRLADEYTGPHDVRIVQNDHNLGIGKHINNIMQLAKGDIIVASAGDDISLPDRVETIVREWVNGSCSIDMLHSQVMKMTPEGQVIQNDYSANHQCSGIYEFIDSNVIIGASEAWSRKLFSRFGPLNPDVVHEDRALGFRALLCGGIKFIERPLVRYRLGGISQISFRTGNELLYDVARISNKRYMDDYRQNYADLMMVDPEGKQYPGLAYTLSERIRYHEARYLLARGEGVIHTLAKFNLRQDPYLLVEGVKYLLPWVYSFYIRMKSHL